jgi:hypothetical protein
VYNSEGVFRQVIIHTVFVLSALALARIDKISSGSHAPAITAGPCAVEYATGASPSDNELRAPHCEQLARELRDN